MPVMSLVFVSKKACQHISVLSDPGVPRTFVGDCILADILYRRTCYSLTLLLKGILLHLRLQ